MNRLFLFSLFMVLNAVAAEGSTNDVGKPIPFAQLPAKAIRFYKDHFVQADVSSVVLFSKMFSKKEYTVYMKDGSKVEFDAKGEWEKVKMKTGTVPEKIIPAGIRDYVNTSFPDESIKELKKTKDRFEVELSNGVEIDFNRQGQFLRIDD